MYIGIDDTDSKEKYCTTYVCKLIIEKLEKKYNLDLPKLIRMNPSVKYKTRGNGGVSINILSKKDNENNSSNNSSNNVCNLTEEDKEYIKSVVINYVEKYTDYECENTNPGIVFLDKEIYDNNENREILRNYYFKVLYDIINTEYTKKILNKINGEYIEYKKGHGIIGALGSIASIPPYTYELLTYREKNKWGTKREIDNNSIIEMDKQTLGYTFNNVNGDKPIIAPNTKCPVLYGVRGIDKNILLNTMNIIKSEKIDKYQLFITNQGTDINLRKLKINEIYENTGVIIYGEVSKNPENIKNIVVFEIKDNTGKINCVAYEPTKQFRNIIRNLYVGDLICVYGTIREQPKEINLEKIKIIKLAKKYIKNKKCPNCSGTLKSKGINSGYKCNSCKTVIPYNEINLIEVKRNIAEGFYEVPVGARRHLSKPLILY